MDAQFSIRALKLIVAICAAGYSTQPRNEEATPDSAFLHRNPEQLAPSSGLFIDRSQPSVPITSSPQGTYSATDSFQPNPAATQCADDSHSPQTPPEMMPNNDTADATPVVFETRLFRYLNYSVMTPEYAFSSDEPGSFLKILSLAEPLPVANAISLKTSTQFVSDDQESHEGDLLASPETALSKSIDAIVSRPMSAINVGAAFSPVTSSGEPLQTPTGSAETPGSRMIEMHYVATLHNFTHPSRDVFEFRHQPLYFEDPNMERCGSSVGCLTEFTSIAHFAIRIPLLPYLMASNSPHDCVRALPDCPTCCQFGPAAYIPQPTVKAVAVQAAATTGFIFLVP